MTAKSEEFCEKIMSIGFYKDIFEHLLAYSPENITGPLRQKLTQGLLGILHNILQRTKNAREAFRECNAVEFLQPWRLSGDFQVRFMEYVQRQVMVAGGGYIGLPWQLVELSTNQWFWRGYYDCGFFGTWYFTGHSHSRPGSVAQWRKFALNSGAVCNYHQYLLGALNRKSNSCVPFEQLDFSWMLNNDSCIQFQCRITCVQICHCARENVFSICSLMP